MLCYVMLRASISVRAQVRDSDSDSDSDSGSVIPVHCVNVVIDADI